MKLVVKGSILFLSQAVELDQRTTEMRGRGGVSRAGERVAKCQAGDSAYVLRFVRRTGDNSCEMSV